jgi:chromosome segregation ATPase
VLLRHEVEELRRLQGELERAAESRKRSLNEELNQTQQQVQVAVRSSRQSTVQTEQKRIELEALTSDLRNTDRKLEDMRRSVRDHELTISSLKDDSNMLNTEVDKLKKESILLRKEDQDNKYQLQLTKNSLDNENKSVEDTRRRLNNLIEEEGSLKESEVRLKSSVTLLRKNLEDTQIELDDSRSSSERERRSFSDLRSRRAMLEADLSRFEEEHKFAIERITEENKRKVEAETMSQKVRDDIIRAQRELSNAKLKLIETTRLEEESKTRESEIKSILEKYRLESSSISVIVDDERQKIDRLKNEIKEKQIDVRQSKENYKLAQIELNSATISLESIKSQNLHAESIKLALNQEIQRLKDASQLELTRTERIENACKESETRYKILTEEITKTETNLHNFKNLASEEATKVADQRRMMKSNLAELAHIEYAITDANKFLFDERTKAVDEISQLNQAKQQAQSRVFIFNEAERRMENNGFIQGAASVGTNGINYSPSVRPHQGSESIGKKQNFLETRRSQSTLLKNVLHSPHFRNNQSGHDNSNDIDLTNNMHSGAKPNEVPLITGNNNNIGGINDAPIVNKLQLELEKLRNQSDIVLGSTLNVNNLVNK